MAEAGKPDPPSRSNYRGSVADLACALRPFVQVSAFLEYGTKLDGKLDKQKILAVSEMWQALRGLQPNLIFTQSSVKQALLQLCSERNFYDVDDTETRQYWAHQMSLKLRAQGTAINQSEHKHPDAAWLVELFGEGREAAPPPAKRPKSMPKDLKKRPSKATNTKGIGGDFIGFCKEHLNAWRAHASDPSEKEWAIDMRRGDSDVLLAVFRDGSSAPIHDIGSDDFFELKKGLGSKQRSTFFEGKAGDKTLFVQARKDRKPLVVIYALDDGAKAKDKYQICSIQVLKFIEAASNDLAKATSMAADLMTKVATQYVNGKIGEDMLNQVRDTLFSESVGVDPEKPCKEPPPSSKPPTSSDSESGDTKDSDPKAKDKSVRKKPAAKGRKRPPASSAATSSSAGSSEVPKIKPQVAPAAPSTPMAASASASSQPPVPAGPALPPQEPEQLPERSEPSSPEPGYQAFNFVDIPDHGFGEINWDTVPPHLFHQTYPSPYKDYSESE